MNALLMDAQNMRKTAECVFSTGRHGQRRSAAGRDAQIEPEREECALGMEQSRRSNYAAVRDALKKPEREECAGGTEQRSINATVTDAQIESSMEVCALDMVQSSRSNYAARKDV